MRNRRETMSAAVAMTNDPQKELANAIAGSRSIDAIDVAIASGADVNKLTILDSTINLAATPYTPLALAVLGKKNDVIRHLIKKGADISIEGAPGKPLLTLAIQPRYGIPSLETITTLLEEGADPTNALLALIMSSGYSNAPIILGILIEYGANVNVIWGTPPTIYTPLHLAVSNKSFKIAEQLLDAGADAKIKDGLNRTAFTILINNIVMNRDVTPSELPPITLLERLLVDPTDITIPLLQNLASLTNPNPLFSFALSHRSADLNLNTRDVDNGFCLLEAVIHFNKPGYFQQLILIPGIDIENPTSNGQTILMRTLTYSTVNKSFITNLISAGANVNAQTKDGFTPLMYACSKNANLEFVRILLSAGADPNKEMKMTATGMEGYVTYPIIYAIRSKSDKIVEALLKAGANPNAKIGKPSQKKTLLFVATQYGTLAIIRILVENGARLEEKLEPSGVTLLVALVEAKTPIIEAIRTLIALGADVNAMTPSGQSLLQKATLNRYTKELNEIIRNPINLWKGMSRTSIEWLNKVFETNVDPTSGARSNAENFSVCPICLGYVVRESGCMIMTHDCRLQPFYDETLYSKFKSGEGTISWCTICGRICNGHNHYQLLPDNSDEEPHVYLPPPGVGYFGSDCVPLGGGGPIEKVIRFRRLKEGAAELQRFIDKMPSDTAREYLIREMWNAPVSASLNLTQIDSIRTAKNFGIPNAIFPANINSDEGILDFRRPPESVTPPVTLTVGEKLPNTNANANANVAENSIGFAADGTVIYLRHMGLDGILQDHLVRREGIGIDTFVHYITDMSRRFADEDFMKCPYHGNGCTSLLFPEEVVQYVPSDIYKKYRRVFNLKYNERKLSGNPAFSIEGVTYDPEVPYIGPPTTSVAVAVGGAGLAGGGARRKTRKWKRKN